MMRGRVGVGRRKEKDKRGEQGGKISSAVEQQGGSTVKGGEWCKMGVRVGRGRRGRRERVRRGKGVSHDSHRNNRVNHHVQRVISWITGRLQVAVGPLKVVFAGRSGQIGGL